MKSIAKYLLLIALPTLVVGCDEGNEFIPDEINHSVISTSFGTSSAVMQVNSTMSFVDLSRGVVSREWTFPEGAVTDVDGNPLTTSSSANQKVCFVEFGEFYIDVKQTFNGDVYLGTEFTGSNTHSETIKVMVLDSVRASYTAVNQSTAEDLIVKDEAKNQIQAGSTIRFNATSTGNPPTNTFTIYNAADGVVATGNAKEDSETGEIYADVQLPIPGVFNVKLASSNDFGYSEVEYTDLIEVIASQEPIFLNKISRATTAPGNVIALEFSRGMVKQEPFDAAGFTLATTNGATTVDISVTDVEIVSNVVNLILSDMIYSSDIVFLSYDNTVAPLAACDNPEIVQESFQNSPVAFEVTDILPSVGYDAGFEGTTDNWAYLWWGGQWGNYASELSTAQVHSGAQSFRIEMSKTAGAGHNDTSVGKSGAIIGNKVEMFPVAADKIYVLGVWTYIESIDANLGTAAVDLLFSLNENTTWDNQMPFNATAPVGEWVYRTQQIPAGNYTGDASILLRGNNQEFDTPFTIYLDDLTLSEAEPRP